jgi:hypothetical protein
MNTELVPGTRVVVSWRGYGHHGIYAGRGRYPLGCIEEISLDHFTGLRPSWCELAEPRSPQVEALGAPLHLLLQAAVSTGPHWKRFLRRVAFLESDGRLSTSREGHAAKWASQHVNRWVDV